MKPFRLVFLYLLLVLPLRVFAQETGDTTLVLRDSVIYVLAPSADESLMGQDIFERLAQHSDTTGAVVLVHHPGDLPSVMRGQIYRASSRPVSGYRIRIYFGNGQKARQESQKAERDFLTLHHDLATYRRYENSFYTVTVGDFRSKSEAAALLPAVRTQFPEAFLVRENIAFPMATHGPAYVEKAVKVDDAGNIYEIPQEDGLPVEAE